MEMLHIIVTAERMRETEDTGECLRHNFRLFRVRKEKIKGKTVIGRWFSPLFCVYIVHSEHICTEAGIRMLLMQMCKKDPKCVEIASGNKYGNETKN